jgi:hypothetical protein
MFLYPFFQIKGVETLKEGVWKMIAPNKKMKMNAKNLKNTHINQGKRLLVGLQPSN